MKRWHVSALKRARQVAVTYQGCKKDSICYPPLTLTVNTANLQVSEPVVGFGVAPAPVAPAGGSGNGGFSLAEDTQDGGMVGSLLASGGAIWAIVSFLAFGLLLAFTPCVLPMYPILSATLAREGEALTARRGFILSLAYVLAMAAAFGLLGVVAAWSGQNLQMVLQSPYAIGAVAALFVVLATPMFGLFELQLPTVWVSRMAGVQAGTRGSVGGAAARGVLSALIVGPCVTAPLAAALLYIPIRAMPDRRECAVRPRARPRHSADRLWYDGEPRSAACGAWMVRSNTRSASSFSVRRSGWPPESCRRK